MGEKNREALTTEFFATEELREVLRWYIELPDDVPVDMDVVLHIMEVVDKREQKEHPELQPNTEEALARFKERLEQLEVDENEKTFDLSPNKPTHMAAPDKPRRSGHRVFHILTKAACTAVAMVVLFFFGIGVASAAGYDAWNKVASWTEEVFTFRERGGSLEVNAPTSHEPDGSGSYTSLQEALDAYGITVQVAPKWIPKGYYAESVTATTTTHGASISALYVSDETLPDKDLNKVIYIDITFIRAANGALYVQKEAENPDIYEANDVEHYIITNTGDLIAVWQREDCECTIGSNGLLSEDLRMIIDSIYWRS